MENKIEGRYVEQGSQSFVITAMPISEILKITRYTERLILGYDEDNKPIYNNRVQRKVEEPRAQKIADFILNDPQAMFPTNLVLGIPMRAIDSIFEEKARVLIKLKEDVYADLEKDVYITIIDGQHRVRGIEIAIERLRKSIASALSPDQKTYYEGQLERLLGIQMAVSFFIDPQLEYQAMVFSTINRTQKRVSQNLVYSLFGLDENDTPQKSALEIVMALNGHYSSPFYNRIKYYGDVVSEEDKRPLSQATMVKSIVALISVNSATAENVDRFCKRSKLLVNNSKKRLPFRKYYASNKDQTIADIMYYYFSAVRNTFVNNGVSLWDLQSEKNILQTTIGYSILMDILVEILDRPYNDEQISISFFEQYLIKAKSIQFFDYAIHTASRKQLINDLKEAIFG